jgi:hypothetical protein
MGMLKSVGPLQLCWTEVTNQPRLSLLYDYYSNMIVLMNRLSIVTIGYGLLVQKHIAVAK